MAKLVVQITGDAKGLKRATAEATAIMSAAEAQMAAAAKKADAEIATSRKATAQESLAAARAAAKEAAQLAKQAAGDDKAAALAKVGNARQAVAEQIALVKALRDAERQARADVAAANKMATAAKRAESERSKIEAKELAQDIRAQARNNNALAGSPTAEPAAAGGSKGASVLQATKQAGAALFAMAATLSRVTAQLEEMEKRLADKTITALEGRENRQEALRLAGFTGLQSEELSRAGEGSVGRYRLADLDAALNQLGAEGGGRLSQKSAEEIFKKSGKQGLSGALLLGSNGFAANDAVQLAERYYTASRGLSLTGDQAMQASRLAGSSEFKDRGHLAAYLAAANESGTDLSTVDPNMPFLNQDALSAAYQRRIGTRRTDAMGRPVNSVLAERNRSEAALAGLSDFQDAQDQALLQIQRASELEQADLITSAGGASGARAASQALGTLNLDGAAGRMGVMPNQGKTIVEVSNMPRAPGGD